MTTAGTMEFAYVVSILSRDRLPASEEGDRATCDELIKLSRQTQYSPSEAAIRSFVSEMRSSANASGEQRILILLRDSCDVLRGFCQIRYFDSSADLDFITVEQQFRGRGLAKALILHGLEFLNRNNIRRILLEAGVSNQAALNLYIRLGFAEIARRTRYYSSGEDAVILEKLI